MSQHRAAAPEAAEVRITVISVSDTRTRETDAGGALVEALAREAGFTVMGRDTIPDDPETVRARVRALAPAPMVVSEGTRPHCILLTGGTGVAPRDGTVEAVAPLITRHLEGFGELFRMLSFAEIGAAAMLSRACAGIVGGDVALFCMPGSPAAIRLAMQRLILPELGHLVAELHRRPAPNHGPDHPHHP